MTDAPETMDDELAETLQDEVPEPQELMLTDAEQHYREIEASKNPAECEKMLEMLMKKDVQEMAQAGNENDSETEHMIDSDPELKNMRDALKAGKFETGGGGIGDKWQKAKKNDADLRARYAAVGKKYADQREFRRMLK